MARKGRQSNPRHREYLYRTQFGRCFYCGRLTPFDEFTTDHLLPRSRGGRNHLENKVGACWRCNQWKADRLLDPEWVEERRVELLGLIHLREAESDDR